MDSDRAGKAQEVLRNLAARHLLAAYELEGLQEKIQAAIADARDAGLSEQRIALIFGRSRSTIQYWQKARGRIGPY
jgi:hypothetical protein